MFELTGQAILRTKTTEELAVVLVDHIVVYKKRGIPTDRLECALSAVHLQRSVTIDWNHPAFKTMM